MAINIADILGSSNFQSQPQTQFKPQPQDQIQEESDVPEDLFDVGKLSQDTSEPEDLFGVGEFVKGTTTPQEQLPSLSPIEDLTEPYKIGANIVGGALLWVPSQIARHGTVGMYKIAQAFADDMQKDSTASPQEKQAATTIANMTPEQIARRGEEVMNFISSAGGFMPEVRSSIGKNIMHGVEKVINAVTAPVKWLGEANVLKLEYGDMDIKELLALKAAGVKLPTKNPNLMNLVTTLGELGTFHTLGKLTQNAKNIIVEKQKLVKDKIDMGDLDGATKELEGFFKSEEVQETIKHLDPDPPGPNSTPQQRQNYINRIYREDIVEGELSTVPYGVSEFIGDQPAVPKPIIKPTKKPNIPVTEEVPMHEIGKPEPYATALARQRYIDRVFRKYDVERELADAPYGLVEKTRLEEMRDIILEEQRQKAIQRISEIQRGRYQEDKLEYERSQREQREKVETDIESPIKDTPKALTTEEAIAKLKEYRIKKMAESDPIKAEMQRRIFEEGIPEKELPREFKDELLKEEIFEEFIEDPYNEFDMSEGIESEGYYDSGYGKEVFDSFFDPIRNEDGAIQLAEIFNSFRSTKKNEKKPRSRIMSVKDLSEKEVKMLFDVEREANTKDISVAQVLKDRGMSNSAITIFENLLNNARTIPRQRKASYERSKIRELDDLDVIKPIEGELQVNNNKLTPIMKPWLDAMKQIPRRIESRVTEFPRQFTTSGTFFRSLPKEFSHLKYHAWRKELDIKRETKEVMKEVKVLAKQFNNVKARNEAGKRQLQKNKHGADALEKMGEKVTNKNLEYDQLISILEPKFEALYNRINEVRKSIGQKPLRKLDNYMPFFTRELWYDKIGKVYELIKDPETGKYAQQFKRTKMSIVNDTAAAINYRHSPKVVEATQFNHISRGKLIKGTKLELDPLQTYLKYTNDAIPYIHMSPLNTFIKHLITDTLTDPVTGTKYKMSMHRPVVAKALGEWSNNLAGVPNFIAPKTIERGAKRLSNNLTAAKLFYNFRTLGVQFTALFPTTVEFGVFPTLKGTVDYMLKPFEGKDVPIKESLKLPAREYEAFIHDLAVQISNNPVSKTMSHVKNFGAKMLSFTDGIAAEITWRTAYNSAYKRMSKKEAIRFADEAVVRTQASGARSDLSPIQMNAIFRAATLWQTYTINHINWIAKDVLGIRNPELTPIKSAERVIRYMAGAAVVAAIFENQLGIQSPIPSPINTIIEGLNNGDSEAAIVLNTMLESAEFFPMASNFKYGSHVGGPVIDYLGDWTKVLSGNDIMYKDILPKAMSGDKKAMLLLADLVSTLAGIPGTGQASKYIRGKMQGKSDFEALIGTKKQQTGSVSF